MKHPCVTWWPEKFLASTADMSPDGAAYYRLLLDHAWMRGGSLPNDDIKLRRMTRLSIPRWRAIRNEILAKFTLHEDGRWHHPRLDLEVERADARHKKRETFLNEATQKLAETNGTKPSKNNDATPPPARARVRDPTPTITELSAPSELREFCADQALSGPAAPLRVRTHAPRPAPNTSTTGYTLNYPDGDYPPEVLPPKNGA